MHRTSRAGFGLILGISLFLGAIACQEPQTDFVQEFNDRAPPIEVSCLDVNNDGRVDASDATQGIVDLTGDGKVDDADFAIVRAVDIGVPEGKPPECKDGVGPQLDWQVSEPPALDCAAGQHGVLVFAIGGGAVDLGNVENAAGARWMALELADRLDVPTQIASVGPGLNRTATPQPYAEGWAFAYLSQRLQATPCLGLVLVGHSHGGVLATAVGSRLESAGLSRQLLLTAAIDRATVLYAGDTESVPQSTPVFNVYLPHIEGDLVSANGPIDQTNVENWDAMGAKAPEHGEEGGKLVPANHTTIDNSPDVLKEVEKRADDAVGSFASGSPGA